MGRAHMAFQLRQLLLLLLQRSVGQNSQSVLCCIRNTGNFTITKFNSESGVQQGSACCTATQGGRVQGVGKWATE